MRLTFFATALAVASLLAGCNKDKNDCTNCLLMRYAQTQCADPWGYGDDGSDVAVEYALRDFFGSRGIVIDEVRVFGAAEPVKNCMACNCPTGKTIYATVNAADSATLTSLGFSK